MVVFDVIVLIRRLRRRTEVSAAAAGAARVRMAGEVAAGLGLCNLGLGLVQRAEGREKLARTIKTEEETIVK